jgi:hypothetical protein
MGLFSSSKSSTTQNTTNKTDQRTYADYSNQGGGSKASAYVDISGDNVNLSMLDGGAINSSFDFAGNVVKSMQSGMQSIVDEMTTAQMSTYKLAQDVVNTATEAQRSESENVFINLIKWGTLAAVVFSVSMIFLKRKN